MARFICMSCYRDQFNVPGPHKKPYDRKTRCKGPFVRIFKTFNTEKWLSAPEPPEVAVPSDPPSFTRAQIARMSMVEFLKNEAAINDALKNNRVR